MAADTNVTDSAGLSEEELAREVERLRLENERLKAGVDATEPAPHREGHALRWTAAVVLLVVGLILVGLSVPTIWINRTIMNTDQWVATVGPLAKDPAIQTAVADKVSNALFAKVDVEAEIRTRLQSVLPTALAPVAVPIAAPIAAQIETYADKLITDVVQSEQFSTIWTETMRTTQKAFVAAIKGGGEKGAVTTTNGVITLYTQPFVSAAQDRLSATKIAGLTKYIPWNRVPESVVLYESPGLARVQTWFGVFNSLVWVLPFLAVVSLGLALWAAPVTRRLWLWVGIGLVIVTLLPFEALVFARAGFINAAYATAQIPNAAAQSFWDIVFRFLLTMMRTMIALGLVITVAAFLAGPSKVALWFRHGIAHGMTKAGGGASFGKFGEFVAANKAALRIGAVVIGVLVAILSAPLTPGFVIGDAIFIALAILLIEFFGQGTPQPELAVAGTGEGAATVAPAEVIEPAETEEAAPEDEESVDSADEGDAGPPVE